MRSFLVTLLMVVPLGRATEANPLAKVLQMISNLQGMVLSQGADEQKTYDKSVAFCQERSQSIAFEIKTAKSDYDTLSATIEEETASVGTLHAQIEDHAADIASDESDLKAAETVRAKEASDFAAEERDLKEITGSLERAISVSTKKLGAAMLQEKQANGITEALRVMVDATAMSSSDASRLTSLVQEHSLENTEEADTDNDAADMKMLGAPTADAYQSHSGGIVGTLEGLLDKADAQLSKVRSEEAKALQNFEQLKQSLANAMKLSKKDLNSAKFSLAKSQEAKGVAVGDLDVTTKDLQRSVDSKELLHHECMTIAEEFQASVAARQEQLTALASARKFIQETSGGAAKQTYMAQVSFAQLGSRTESRATSGLAKFEVVHFVRKLAAKTKSVALAQLASRMSSAVQLAGGQDPFENVKGLISGMVSQLEEEGEGEASHKAYCDKERVETDTEKDDSTSERNGLRATRNQKKARSVKLKEQVAALQNELALIAKADAEVSQLRLEEATVFKKNRDQMQQGLDGIRLALKTLKEYYAKAPGNGAEGGIIGLLETIESDFAKGLVGLKVEEEAAATHYRSDTKPNLELEQASKEKNLQLKTKEYMSQDKSVAEMTNDVAGVENRLDAIYKFDAMLKKTCVSESLPYEERKRRREEELAGLKEALVSIESVAFVQISSEHKLRGTSRHIA